MSQQANVGLEPFAAHAIVLAYNQDTNEYIIATAYEPSREAWEADFKRRKP